MKSKWKIMHNNVGGEKWIQVYRIRDIGQPVHAGNLEFLPETFRSDCEARAKVDELNGEATS